MRSVRGVVGRAAFGLTVFQVRLGAVQRCSVPQEPEGLRAAAEFHLLVDHPVYAEEGPFPGRVRFRCRPGQRRCERQASQEGGQNRRTGGKERKAGRTGEEDRGEDHAPQGRQRRPVQRRQGRKHACGAQAAEKAR